MHHKKILQVIEKLAGHYSSWRNAVTVSFLIPPVENFSRSDGRYMLCYTSLSLTRWVAEMIISRSNVQQKLRFAFTSFFVVSGLAAGIIAQEQPQQTTEPAKISQNPSELSPASDVTDSSLRIGAGDLLEFSVYNVPDLSTKTRVSSSGDAYLPLIDYVHVGDLTVEEAQTVVEKKLSDGQFLKDPHVTLFVDQFASQGVSVLGEVARPGVYPVLGEQRLFDVVSAAGGLTDRAGHSVTITHRKQRDKPVIVELARNIADRRHRFSRSPSPERLARSH